MKMMRVNLNRRRGNVSYICITVSYHTERTGVSRCRTLKSSGIQQDVALWDFFFSVIAAPQALRTLYGRNRSVPASTLHRTAKGGARGSHKSGENPLRTPFNFLCGDDEMDKNIKRSVSFSPDTLDKLKKYAAGKIITTAQAIRDLVSAGLSTETYLSHQNEIRNYIREEIETVLPIAIKPYMDRLIKMQANTMRTSAATLMCTVMVLAENYIDTATPEEILANAFHLATRITKSKPKSEEEYLAEAREWLGADLGKTNDS